MKRIIRVLHLLDSTIGWDQRLALEQLLERLPAERYRQHLVALGPLQGEPTRIDAPVRVLPRRFNLDVTVAPALRGLIRQGEVDLIHTWGAPACGAAVAAGQAGVPIVASVFESGSAEVYSKRLRAGGGGARVAAICASELVRHRLVERGARPDTVALVRPGLDFATIDRVKKSDLRARLGLSSEAVALVTDQPVTRAGGQFSAFWAVAVRFFLEPNVRVVLPACSREVSRLRRLAAALGQSDVLILPGDRYRFEELIAVADGLLMPAMRETSVTAIAWAMAAGVPVLASGTRANAELLTHDHNAFLVKPDAPKRLAMRFADAIGKRRQWSRQVETARGQAYELFSLRRCIAQTQQVYENTLENRPLSDDTQAPAVPTPRAGAH